MARMSSRLAKPTRPEESKALLIAPTIRTETMTLMVGSERQPFMFRRDQLCASSHIFNNNSQISQGIPVEFPKDTPEAVSCYADWLSCSALPEGNDATYIRKMIHLYIFAARIADHKLANEVMDKIQDTCLEHDLHINLPDLRLVFDKSSQGLPIRSFALDLRLHRLMQDAKPKRWGKIGPTDGDFFLLANRHDLSSCFSFLNSCEGFQNEFVYRMQFFVQLLFTKDSYDPRVRGKLGAHRCAFHIHIGNDDVPCAASKPNSWHAGV